VFSPGKQATEFTLVYAVSFLIGVLVLLVVGMMALHQVRDTLFQQGTVCASSVGPVDAYGNGDTTPETDKNCP